MTTVRELVVGPARAVSTAVPKEPFMPVTPIAAVDRALAVQVSEVAGDREVGAEAAGEADDNLSS